VKPLRSLAGSCLLKPVVSDPKDRHAPARWCTYKERHSTAMKGLLDDQIIQEDAIDFDYVEGAGGKFVYDGQVTVCGRLVLSVTKVIAIFDATTEKGNPVVQTKSYSYNLRIPGLGSVFRYCSPHPSKLGHEMKSDPDGQHHAFHHRHEFDPWGADEARFEGTVNYSPERPNWPLLDAIIREAAEWYREHEAAVLAAVPEASLHFPERE